MFIHVSNNLCDIIESEIIILYLLFAVRRVEANFIKLHCFHEWTNQFIFYIPLCSRLWHEMHIQRMSNAFGQERTYVHFVYMNKSRVFWEKLKMCGDIFVRGYPISLFSLIQHLSGMRDNNNKICNRR